MDIFQVLLLCIFGVSFIWFICRWINYENNLFNWNYDSSKKPNIKPTFWNK